MARLTHPWNDIVDREMGTAASTRIFGRCEHRPPPPTRSRILVHNRRGHRPADPGSVPLRVGDQFARVPLLRSEYPRPPPPPVTTRHWRLENRLTMSGALVWWDVLQHEPQALTKADTTEEYPESPATAPTNAEC